MTRIPRRDVLRGTTLPVVASLAGLADAAPRSPSGSTSIVEENARPGALDWQLTRVWLNRPDGFRSPRIEGYCSHRSIRAGETLRVMASMDPPGRARLDVFRTGYYAGAGARQMLTLPPQRVDRQPVPPADPETRLRECRWSTTFEFQIPDDWISGVYLGRLTTVAADNDYDYWQSYVVFIVRDDRDADIVLQCSDNTWQAYNRWPDSDSLYTHSKGTQGPWAQVSFDRPYGKYAQIYENPMSVGSGEWLCFEFPLAYWLEQHGYDVTYCSNADMLDVDPQRRIGVFISNGHDEYWDLRQFRSVEGLRDRGTTLLFLTGNGVCWVSPQSANAAGEANRRLFRGGPYGGSYRYAELRQREHGPFPHLGPDEGYLIGARNVEPVNGGGDWRIERPDHWLFEGLDVAKGERVPGLVGWEYHGDPPEDLHGLEVVAAGTALKGGRVPQQWAATIYPGPAENFVFNASTIFWSQGLASPPGHMLPWSHYSRPHGPDARVQQMMHNLLQRAGVTARS